MQRCVKNEATLGTTVKTSELKSLSKSYVGFTNYHKCCHNHNYTHTQFPRYMHLKLHNIPSRFTTGIWPAKTSISPPGPHSTPHARSAATLDHPACGSRCFNSKRSKMFMGFLFVDAPAGGFQIHPMQSMFNGHISLHFTKFIWLCFNDFNGKCR